MTVLIWLASSIVSPAFVAKSCPESLVDDSSVVCGVVRVPENRRRRGGRAIDLNVVVLRATQPKPDLPPLFDLEGGPGLAATRSIGFYRTDGIAYRQRRDVILVDQRGTGQSNPLICPKLAAPAMALQPIYPPKLVTECRRALEGKADLRHYGTMDAAADLDTVREALGHPRIDMVAISYGTTVALRYMAAYPNRVRAAVLSGVVPASAMPPSMHSPNADAALEQLFSDCAADTDCHANFPTLAADFSAAAGWLRAHPGKIEEEVFAEKIRSMLYQPASARKVPFLLHRAAAGDFAPFMATATPREASPFVDGVYLSITCSESIATMDYAKAAAASRRTRFGDYRLRRQRAACALWPVGPAPRSLFKPVTAKTAVLLISGGRDPVTPQDWASDVARHLPNSRQLSIPASGHGIDGLSNLEDCYDPLILKFFETADPQSVDPTCLPQMRPPAFMTAEKK